MAGVSVDVVVRMDMKERNRRYRLELEETVRALLWANNQLQDKVDYLLSIQDPFQALATKIKIENSFPTENPYTNREEILTIDYWRGIFL